MDNGFEDEEIQINDEYNNSSFSFLTQDENENENDGDKKKRKKISERSDIWNCFEKTKISEQIFMINLMNFHQEKKKKNLFLIR